MKPQARVFKLALGITVAMIWAVTEGLASVISLDGQWLLAPDRRTLAGTGSGGRPSFRGQDG